MLHKVHLGAWVVLCSVLIEMQLCPCTYRSIYVHIVPYVHSNVGVILAGGVYLSCLRSR